MSTPHHQADARCAADSNRTGAVEASRASMRRELARAGLNPNDTAVGGPAQAAPAATGVKTGDAQANMRRQLARAGLAPSSNRS